MNTGAGISASVVSAFVTWIVVSFVFSLAFGWSEIIAGGNPACASDEPLCGDAYNLPEGGDEVINAGRSADIGIASALGLTKGALTADYAIFESRHESAIVQTGYYIMQIFRIAIVIGAAIGVFALLRG